MEENVVYGNTTYNYLKTWICHCLHRWSKKQMKPENICGLGPSSGYLLSVFSLPEIICLVFVLQNHQKHAGLHADNMPVGVDNMLRWECVWFDIKHVWGSGSLQIREVDLWKPWVTREERKQQQLFTFLKCISLWWRSKGLAPHCPSVQLCRIKCTNKNTFWTPTNLAGPQLREVSLSE